MKYPILILSIFWLFGLILSYYLPLPTVIIFLLLIAIIILLVSSVVAFTNKKRIWFILLTVALFASGIVRMELHQTSHESAFTEEMVQELSNKKIGVRGYFSTTPTIDGNSVKFEFKPISYLDNGTEYKIDSGEKFIVNLYLKKIEEIDVVKSWKNGMGVNLSGELAEIHTNKNPGQFNYNEYLARKNIFWKIKADDISNIKISDASLANKSFSSLRDRLSTTIDSLFEEKESGFIKSIILGDRNDLSVDLKNYFSIAGLSHLLAISGLHLSIIAFLLYKLMTKLRVTKEKSAIMTCVILIFYMVLTGASPSVVRATIMAILLFCGYIFKNKFSALQTLGIALIAMTIYNPYWFLNIGFQLSFIITFYILWGLPKLNQLLSLDNSKFKNALTLVLITQLTSFPLAFYHFHQYSIISFLTNLVLVPLFSTIILPFSLLILISGSISLGLGSFLANIMSHLLKKFFYIIEWSANISSLHFYGSIATFFWVIVIYMLITWCLVRKEVKNSFLSFNKRRIIFYFEKLIILTLLIVLLLTSLPELEKCEIIALDVGQGDSIYLNLENEANILIDSGGIITFNMEEWKRRKNPFDTGKDIVLPFLHYKGVSKLDLAILTHEDTDHIGGYSYLVDNIEIDTFIVESGFPRTNKGKELYDKILDKNIKIIYIDETTVINLNDEIGMYFIPVNIEGSDSQNNHSFVIVSNIYDTRVLFAGDVEEAGESSILNKFNIEPVDILKVGHHGSNTSTTEDWLEVLQPKDAVISVGRNNRYNHPSEVVIQRLNEDEINIWRTDLDGAVMIDIRPENYEIFTN